MSKIEKSEIIERTIKGLRLNRVENLNGFIAGNQINPVFVVNEVPIIRYLVFASTAIGNAITIPQGKFWRIKSMQIAITTTATVGNRLPILTINMFTTAATQIWKNIYTQNQVASSTRPYFANIGVPITTGAGYENLCIPDIWLNSGSNFAISDSNSIDAADTVIYKIIVEEISINSNYSEN